MKGLDSSVVRVESIDSTQSRMCPRRASVAVQVCLSGEAEFSSGPFTRPAGEPSRRQRCSNYVTLMLKHTSQVFLAVHGRSSPVALPVVHNGIFELSVLCVANRMVTIPYLIENVISSRPNVFTFPSAQRSTTDFDGTGGVSRCSDQSPVHVDDRLSNGREPFDVQRQSVVAERGIDNSCNSVVVDLGVLTTDLRRSQSKDPLVDGLLQATLLKRTPQPFGLKQ